MKDDNKDNYTWSEMCNQFKYQSAGLHTGEGVVNQLYQGGPFVVYSRITLDTLLREIKKVKPDFSCLEDMKTIFLLGPTPVFFGDKRATTSWRRSFVEWLLETRPSLKDDILIVIPEPEGCDWKGVDYPTLTEPNEHICAQTHWENYFINLAAKTGILVLHAHFRWSGNAGPTARLEGGKLFSLASSGELNGAVVNFPSDTQTAQYIKVHLLDAIELYEKGRFVLTSCSPLDLNEKGEPIDKDGNIVAAGVYENGGVETNNLAPFYEEIVKMARLL
jgi:hypothetical protein